ncbi:hypothetical protein GWI33_010615 [Rhynchophorus ferrugineus]|uniref:Uncharacterized protein n=1 Tax=Rhynchophorus ferrugineus TaxID=354439 RepID=A0A834IUR1_RHYFE|nr:hypothetical protein GWI33_010615 [Rhynchophorus ferrugineus]
MPGLSANRERVMLPSRRLPSFETDRGRTGPFGTIRSRLEFGLILIGARSDATLNAGNVERVTWDLKIEDFVRMSLLFINKTFDDA